MSFIFFKVVFRTGQVGGDGMDGCIGECIVQWGDGMGGCVGECVGPLGGGLLNRQALTLANREIDYIPHAHVPSVRRRKTLRKPYASLKLITILLTISII